ncbi:MAG: LD-carboxypeptidase [Bacteroidales bacterium]|nr:LD-carboxypeptidase [Bacteroidales bacterium]
MMTDFDSAATHRTTPHPPLLRSGDRVAIVAPARWITPEEVQPAVQLLRSWGLEVWLPEGLYEREAQLAGSDAHRTAVMQRLLDEPTVRAVFCARGGYGTVRMVDGLDFAGYRRAPKWVVGYSDITVLHAHLQAMCLGASLHATMPINLQPQHLQSPTPAVSTLHDWLFRGKVSYRFASDVHNRCGEAVGEVVGGNLSVLYSLMGSHSLPKTAGRILLIEDLDEYVYHVDRMMQCLLRAGILTELAGLVVGGLTDMHDNAVPFGRSACEVVADAVARFDYPVCFGAPFGHLGDDNCALPIGVPTHLVVGREACTLSASWE